MLPISIVDHIVSKSEEEISSDLLFDFISKSIEERFTLLSFLNIQNLTDSKFGELFDLYDQHPKYFFQYLPLDISFLKSIKDENKKIKDENVIFIYVTKIENYFINNISKIFIFYEDKLI